MPITLSIRQSIRLLRLSPLVFAAVCQHIPVNGNCQGEYLKAYDRTCQQGSRGYEWLRWSTLAIGHRLTGSAQGAMAEKAADSLFRMSGLPHVSRFPFSAQAWSRGAVRVTVGDGEGFRHLAAVALANTPLESHVEAPLLDAGNGLHADWERLGASTKGRAVLVNIGLADAGEGARNLHRSEKAKLAMDHGASALLFVNQAEGPVLLTGTASIDGALIPAPAICLSSDDGATLRKELAKGAALSARIDMSNTSSVVQANNIIAEIPGSTKPEEVILVGGHLDCWDLATGATDNGLGSFSILDMARAMAGMPFKPERTIRFVLFMGEEQGLLGSRALVEHYKKVGEISRIRCMVNLDMSGNPQGFGIGGPKEWSEVVTRSCAAIREVDSAAFAGRVSQEVWLHSDHQPFLLAGVPVIYPLSDLGKHVYGCYHSSCDDIHLVEPQAMVNNARFVGALLYLLAAEPALPAHFTEEALRERLIEAGLEQALRIGGDWPW
ncbi:MAG: M20/M25/M40 family metallo-hydrolase [Flavobacteriales bacterium]|nr:M20/M25/M40 family metallo-hydrolase [Flavobacteriales bacterium]